MLNELWLSWKGDYLFLFWAEPGESKAALVKEVSISTVPLPMNHRDHKEGLQVELPVSCLHSFKYNRPLRRDPTFLGFCIPSVGHGNKKVASQSSVIITPCLKADNSDTGFQYSLKKKIGQENKVGKKNTGEKEEKTCIFLSINIFKRIRFICLPLFEPLIRTWLICIISNQRSGKAWFPCC